MNTSTFSDFFALFDVLPGYLIFLVCFGLSAVGAGFLISMPIVGNVVAIMWTTVFGEQLAARARGQESGTDMGL